MIALPLTLLALAAGAFLLLRAKKEQMGKVFEWLAWLIIVLSILYIIGLGLMGWHHHRMMRRGMMDRGMMMNHMGGRQGCGMGNCCDDGQGNSCCSGMNMGGSSCCNGSCGMDGKGMGGSCNMMMGHDMPACCMGDSAHGKDGKGACCAGAKPDEKKSGK